MLRYLMTAFALMLIIEGIFPFISPASWRETFKRLINMADGQLRFVALFSMLAGLVLLMLVQ